MSADYETSIKRWKLLDSLATSKRNPWEDEKQLLESGLHSQFVDGISQCRELCEQKLERIADIRNREVARAENTYKHEVDLLEKEYENRVSEVVENLWLELEEKKRQLDSDISSLDISRWDGSFGSSDSNWSAHAGQSSSLWMNAQQITSQGILGKKQLRRRPNEVGNCSVNVSSVAAESSVSASVFSEKKGRKRSPGAANICPLITQSLLSAQAIAEDVEKLCPLTIDRNPSSSSWSSSKSSVINGASPLIGTELATCNNLDNFDEQRLGSTEMRSVIGSDVATNADEMQHRRLDHENSRLKRHPRKVVLEFGKLSLDGKTYHRGQNVFIKSSNTGWKSMQALVMQVNELTVQFRSSIPGDTRTVTATKEDLESGRVLVKKRY
uniref:Uncharacterized protein n=1 Tax=Meloidogyne enterolobii TaxID=390850 RepID=A0A6V7XQ52_MELEN|nr:unnamed protein product [Meloidogyne enterolobii]